MTVFIFANGDLPNIHDQPVELADASLIIAADGGAQHLLALGARPDIVVGDMDSLEVGQRAVLEESGATFMEHPASKDETDLELALLFAVSRYDDPIRVYAGIGGRLDQTIANILLLMHPQLRHRDIRFLTEYQQIWLVHEETEIRGRPGDTVSLIPLGGDVTVSRTSGLRWPLCEEVLSIGPARGLSNLMDADKATVAVLSGYLLCVHTRQEWGR